MKKIVSVLVLSLVAMTSAFAARANWLGVSTTALGLSMGNPKVKIKYNGSTISNEKAGFTTVFTMLNGMDIEGASYFDYAQSVGIKYQLAFGPGFQSTSTDGSNVSSSDIAGYFGFSYRSQLNERGSFDLNAGLALSTKHQEQSSAEMDLRGVSLVFEIGGMFDISDNVAIRAGLDASVPLYFWGEMKSSGDTYDITMTPNEVDFFIPVGLVYKY